MTREISFIHIGKTGGTTVLELLRKVSKYKSYHLTNNYDMQNKHKFVIWIRNPIARFVSAFNYAMYAFTVNINTIKSFDLEHCLMPIRLKNSIGKKFVFSERYDQLIKKFKSPNNLAESLTSTDPTIKMEAIELMNSTEEHIFKGTGYYLWNGEFIKKHNDRILFVGTQENMIDDIKKLSKSLNVELDHNLKLRENIYVSHEMKYMSPLAIQNIIDWYKDTDYLTLRVLMEYGWITENIYDSYFHYEIE